MASEVHFELSLDVHSCSARAAFRGFRGLFQNPLAHARAKGISWGTP